MALGLPASQSVHTFPRHDIYIFHLFLRIWILYVIIFTWQFHISIISHFCLSVSRIRFSKSSFSSPVFSLLKYLYLFVLFFLAAPGFHTKSFLRVVILECDRIGSLLHTWTKGKTRRRLSDENTHPVSLEAGALHFTETTGRGRHTQTSWETKWGSGDLHLFCCKSTASNVKSLIKCHIQRWNTVYLIWNLYQGPF